LVSYTFDANVEFYLLDHTGYKDFTKGVINSLESHHGWSYTFSFSVFFFFSSSSPVHDKLSRSLFAGSLDRLLLLRLEKHHWNTSLGFGEFRVRNGHIQFDQCSRLDCLFAIFFFFISLHFPSTQDLTDKQTASCDQSCNLDLKFNSQNCVIVQGPLFITAGKSTELSVSIIPRSDFYWMAFGSAYGFLVMVALLTIGIREVCWRRNLKYITISDSTDSSTDVSNPKVVAPTAPILVSPPSYNAYVSSLSYGSTFNSVPSAPPVDEPPPYQAPPPSNPYANQ
jgi:hypothetical protein